VNKSVEYKADGQNLTRPVPISHWNMPTAKPSKLFHTGRFMPRWASRTLLEIVSLRIERVHEITDADAIAEGIAPNKFGGWNNYLWHGHHGRMGMGNKQSDAWPYQFSNYENPRDSFSSLWESINGPRGFGWTENPFVFVIGFKVLPNRGVSPLAKHLPAFMFAEASA
jgi:hypothetical protein